MDYPCIFNDVIYLELLLCAILYLLRKIQKQIIQIFQAFPNLQYTLTEMSKNIC